MENYDLKEIEKEHWMHAKGVRYHRGETNAALAERDYSVACRTPHKIAVVSGYFIWWCSAHHQPLSHCDMARFRFEVFDFAASVEKADKTTDYNYGGEQSKNNMGLLPPKGSRWLTPRELARDFLAIFKR